MSSTSLPDLITQFLNHLEIEKNASKLTIRDYKHYLKVFTRWFEIHMPDKTVADIKLPVIRDYRIFLSQRTDEHGENLARVTQNYYVIALRSFLKYCLKNDIQTLEPTKIDLPKTESRSLKFLERDQVERLIGVVPIKDDQDESGLRDRAILELLFSTGLRVSELAKLNHEQINFERREFGVIGKGGKSRIVFISDRASSYVQQYLTARKDTYKPLFIRYAREISEDDGGEKMRLTVRSIERIVKKYVKLARLPVDASAHTMRHSFATDLLTNGADLRSVQEMLGHKNIATTQIYTHITNKQLREVHKNFHSGNKG